MTLEEAISLLRKGKKIRRAAWGNRKGYECFLYYNKKRNVFVSSHVPMGLYPTDILADDWEVVE